MNTSECQRCDYNCCEKTNKFIMNLQKKYNDLEKENKNIKIAYDKLNESYYSILNTANKISIEKYDLEKQNKAWKDWVKGKEKDFDYKLEQYVKEVNRLRTENEKMKETIKENEKTIRKNQEIVDKSMTYQSFAIQASDLIEDMREDNKKLKEEIFRLQVKVNDLKEENEFLSDWGLRVDNSAMDIIESFYDLKAYIIASYNDRLSGNYLADKEMIRSRADVVYNNIVKHMKVRNGE